MSMGPGMPAGSGPSDAAGAVDDEAGIGPQIVGDGISVPRAVYHDGSQYQPHRDRDDSATAVPVHDSDGDDGLPDIPRYEGPQVADQPALVNPSAGNSSGPGGGVNPMGPSPVPGSVPAPNVDQAPGNTSQGYPS